MPQNEMFTNHEALITALRRVKRKSDTALKLIGEYSDGKKGRYDKRNLTPLAAILIDVSDVPEAQREEFFKGEVLKLADAFNTIDPATGRPFPEAVKPYIEKMYKNIPTDLDSIDWNDERQVERFLYTLPLDQCSSTMLLDFKKECFEIFPSAKELEKLDATLTKMHFNYLKAEGVLKSKVNNIKDYLNIAATNINGLESKIEIIIGNAVADATLGGSDVINIDPEEHELLMDCMLKKKFSVEEVFDAERGDFNTYTDVTCTKNILYELTKTYSRNPVEQTVVDKLLDSDEFEESSLLFINGKPMSDIVSEIRKNQNKSAFEANNDAAMLLRNALTDGKSVVSVMKIGFDKDGNTHFRHQEVKVDLDKLNRKNFEEKYKTANFLRRFLHDIKIWRIPNKYATNEARDKAQAIQKERPEHNEMLRAAERKTVEIYNKQSRKNKSTDKNEIFNLIPELKVSDAKIASRESFPVGELAPNKNDISKEKKPEQSVPTQVPNVTK